MTPALFQPLKVGHLQLSHRVALAPLTRLRADDYHVPTDLAIEYYTQRAAVPGTLLIAEGTLISPSAAGLDNTPGIWTDAQVAGWKKIVDAVHSKGSHVFLQLYAMGRAASPASLSREEGPGAPYDVVAPSAIAFKAVGGSGGVSAGGAQPREMRVDEIEQTILEFGAATKRFVQDAGGDGVEIHLANGYLLDQFLQTTSNFRTDHYGGSVENRCRFPLAAVTAAVDAVGAEKVGVRLSPYSDFQDMKMPHDDLEATFSFVTSQLKRRFPELAYLHVVESRVAGAQDRNHKAAETLDFIYDIWTPNVFLAAGGFDRDSAIREAEHRKNTIVVFGRHFISNPDLVRKLQDDLPLTPHTRDLFYAGGATGYLDYPIAA